MGLYEVNNQINTNYLSQSFEKMIDSLCLERLILYPDIIISHCKISQEVAFYPYYSSVRTHILMAIGPSDLQV